MDWKKGTLRSILKLNKEKLIFIFCSGLLLFVLALPSDSDGLVAKTGAIGQSGSVSDMSSIGQTGGVSDTSTAVIPALADTYETELELRVRNILSGVEGVGEVEVMVALKPADETDIFEEADTQEVLGIIISADGGGSSVVKTEISEAMEALFGLPAHKIKVLKRVKKGV